MGDAGIQVLGWTQEQKDEIVRRFQDGETASYIQRDYPGVSRNAIIGVIHRAGVHRTTQATQALSRWSGNNRPKAQPKPKAAKPKPIIEDEPIIIGPINDFPPLGYCRHTHDEPGQGEWRMCGQPTGIMQLPDSARPWCHWHQYHVIESKTAKKAA